MRERWGLEEGEPQLRYAVCQDGIIDCIEFRVLFAFLLTEEYVPLFLNPTEGSLGK